MKKISSQEIEHIVKLANLSLSEEELKKFTSQLSEVIDFNFSRLSKIDTGKVEPTAYALGTKNRLRADDTEPGLSAKETLQNAKETHNDFFKVKAILDQTGSKVDKG